MECVYTRVQGPPFCRGRESILNLISIFSLHFDIRLLDFVVLAYPAKRRLTIVVVLAYPTKRRLTIVVVLAYPTKRRLTIGNSCIDLLLIQRNLLFRIPSQNLKRILISF